MPAGRPIGTGAISAWILARLKESDASVYEISLGSQWSPRQIHDRLKELRERGVVRVAREAGRGVGGRKARRYHLPPGVDYKPRMYETKGVAVVNHRAMRGLHDAWSRIVVLSTATTG